MHELVMAHACMQCMQLQCIIIGYIHGTCMKVASICMKCAETSEMTGLAWLGHFFCHIKINIIHKLKGAASSMMLQIIAIYLSLS